MTIPKPSIPAAVSVSQMADMCNLSRSRWYSLVGEGTFPPPVRIESGNRPIYVRELIQKCLEIRRTGVGLDGRFVVFNRKRRQRKSPSSAQHRTPPVQDGNSQLAELMTGLRSLGLDVTESQVASAVVEHFPKGITELDPGDVIRAVFLALKKK